MSEESVAHVDWLERSSWLSEAVYDYKVTGRASRD